MGHGSGPVDTLGGRMLTATGHGTRSGACRTASVVYFRGNATVDLLDADGALLFTAEHHRVKSVSPRKLVDRTVAMTAGDVWMTGAEARIDWKR